MLTTLWAVAAGPHSPFAAVQLSPQPFRVKVSGRAFAQPVRRYITYLLPVGPTVVGRTTLTSQDAPKRVSLGELKAKLTRLENRLSVERCPYCGGMLPSHTEEEEVDYESMTNEERGAIIARSIAATYGREELLDLLAHLRSSW